jgi:CubicO group peptidase (beta-lactamase class C family)
VRTEIALDTFIDNLVRNDGPLGAAGRYAYTNSGYALLTFILERDVGGRWHEYVNTNIFRTARMARAGVTDWPANNGDAAGFAQGLLRVARNPLVVAPEIHHAWANGAGAIYATVSDLFNLHRALQDAEDVLAFASQRDVYRNHSGDTGLGYAYGHGWKVNHRATINGRARAKVFHDGLINGFSAYFLRFLDDDVSVIVLSNIEEINVPNALNVINVGDALARTALVAPPRR